jgi:hypothetical protein
VDTLNEEQKALLSAVKLALGSSGVSVMYVEAPGGTGKTYTAIALAAFLQDQEANITTFDGRCSPDLHTKFTAYTSSAATLLPSGSTMHSFFRLNVSEAFEDVHIREVDGWSAEQAVHDSFRSWSVIVIDEVSMVTRFQFEAIHDFLTNKVGWNGVLLLMGNVPQLACVVKGGTPGDVIANHITASTVLRRQLANRPPITFTQLMRTSDATDVSYRNLCWSIGYRLCSPAAILQSDPLMQLIQIPRNVLPSDVCDRGNVLKGMKWLFPEFFRPVVQVPSAPETTACFVTTKRDQAREYNDFLVRRLPGEARCFTAVQRTVPSGANVTDNEGSLLDDIEISDAAADLFDASGVPDYTIVLKVGATVVLLRTLHQEAGLIKGVRAVVVHMLDRCVKVALQDGSQHILCPIAFDIEPAFVDKSQYCNRRKLAGIQIHRTQLPLQLAYSATVHKVQGMTISRLVIDASLRFFAHGQAYVALSRVRSKEDVWLLADADDITSEYVKIHNVCYEELLAIVDLDRIRTSLGSHIQGMTLHSASPYVLHRRCNKTALCRMIYPGTPVN